MGFKNIRIVTRRTLAGFMATWLSGVVFLLCCSTMDGKSMEADFCPLARMSAHCDKANQANADSSFAESTGETVMDCCGFLPAVFDKARKLEQTQKHFAVTPKPAALKFRLPTLAHQSLPVIAFHSRMPDRQTTFVKNCAFRI